MKRFEMHLVKSGFCQDALSSAEQVRKAFPEMKERKGSFPPDCLLNLQY